MLAQALPYGARVKQQAAVGMLGQRQAAFALDRQGVIHAIDTYAAAAAGAYALTENFLYTKEAFKDYFRTLSDDGVLTISRWMFYPPREDLRLFSTALQALQELGVENPRVGLVQAWLI